MKRITTFLVCILMIVSFCSCGKVSSIDIGKPDTNESAQNTDPYEEVYKHVEEFILGAWYCNYGDMNDFDASFLIFNENNSIIYADTLEVYINYINYIAGNNYNERLLEADAGILTGSYYFEDNLLYISYDVYDDFESYEYNLEENYMALTYSGDSSSDEYHRVKTLNDKDMFVGNWSCGSSLYYFQGDGLGQHNGSAFNWGINGNKFLTSIERFNSSPLEDYYVFIDENILVFYEWKAEPGSEAKYYHITVFTKI